jgi:hypothetical protein
MPKILRYCYLISICYFLFMWMSLQSNMFICSVYMHRCMRGGKILLINWENDEREARHVLKSWEKEDLKLIKCLHWCMCRTPPPHADRNYGKFMTQKNCICRAIPINVGQMFSSHTPMVLRARNGSSILIFQAGEYLDNNIQGFYLYSPSIVAPRMPNSPNSGIISLWKSTHYKNP